MTHPTNQLHLPASLQQRISRYVRRRLLVASAAVACLVIGVTALILVTGAALDHLFMLPTGVRIGWMVLATLPTIAGLLLLLTVPRRAQATEEDLRTLDNSSDDMRAAMNLADRLEHGDLLVNARLAAETAGRSQAVAVAPLPAMPVARRRLIRHGILALLALALLAGLAIVAPDLHTVIRRMEEPRADFGTVGSRKFQVQAEVWTNPAANPAFEPDNADAAPRGTVAFQRESLVDGTWVRHGTPVTTWADRLTGYNPLALARRHVEVLAGDKVVLTFNAVDDRRSVTTDGLEFLRLEEGRRIPRQTLSANDLARLDLPRVEETQRFLLRTDETRSPVYELKVIPRPTPRQVILFHSPPAHYGQSTQESVVRDLDRGVDGNRLSGLPGARLAVEFETAYGEDLDARASHASIAGRRLPIRRLTTRNAQLASQGLKRWTVDFILDETIANDPKLYLHLVTGDARFDGEPIRNRYDDPLLIHIVDDQPPTVELTMLPTERHFEKDAAFAFRYRYADDHGIAEIGLELQPNPTQPQKEYIPLTLRPPESGTVRKSDELMHIIDLATIRGNYLAFSIVVKDLMGQEARTSLVSISMSRHFTEELLPKLTGGWHWTRSHDPNRPIFREGDLETPPSAKALNGYQAALGALLAALADGSLDEAKAKALAKRLQFTFQPLLDAGGFDALPFAFHHRDYPYTFQRQASTYLTGLAALGDPSLLAAAGAALAAGDAEALQKLKALQPELQQEFDLATSLSQLHREVALRAALLQAAYLCDRIGRGLEETEREFAMLTAAADGAPPVGSGDPWRIYVAQMTAQHQVADQRQQAELVRLQVRNLNQRMARLNAALARIQMLGGEELDPRLRAAIGMVHRFGTTVYDIDRSALTARLELLARFIRLGILASESAIYTEIDSQYEGNETLAREALADLPAVATYATHLAAVRAAARDLSYAQLHRQMGAGSFAADTDLKVRRNQESRLRSELELLNRQASSILFAEPFLSCTDLAATIREAEQLVQTLDSIREWLPGWPRLAAQRPLLDRATTAMSDYQTSARRLLDLQRRVGILADFAPMFAASGDEAAPISTALSELQTVTDTASATSARLKKIADLEGKRPANPTTEQQQEQLAEIDGQIAALAAEAEAGLAALRTNLETLAAAFERMAGEAKELNQSATSRHDSPPLPLISGATISLFQRFAPDALLAELQQELKRHAGDTAKANAALDQARQFFRHYPTDAGNAVLGNPLGEYLYARIALALITSNPADIEPFASTFTRRPENANERILNHLSGLEPPDWLKQWVADQPYQPPTLPTALADLAKPILDARRANTLPAWLEQRRAASFAELDALSKRLGPHLDAFESVYRARALAMGIDELLEDLHHYHREPGDIRIEESWARLCEQAEGLDRELRGGRLPVIVAAERQALHEQMSVFRLRDVASVLQEASHLAGLRAYRDTVAALVERLRPSAMQAAEIVAGDRASFTRDLSIAMLTALDTHTWYRRKLAAELQLMEAQLANLTENQRVGMQGKFGPISDARDLVAATNLFSFAWRSLCVLEAQRYALAPTPATTLALTNDLAAMLAHKMLPEYYYDSFTGKIALRRYIRTGASPTALLSQMIESVDHGHQTIAYLIQHQLASEPLPTPGHNRELQNTLNRMGVISVAFQIEKELTRFEQIASLVYGDEAGRRRAAARIRTLYAAHGAFWQEAGGFVSDYIEHGEALLALNPRTADATVVRPILAHQQERLDGLFRYLDRVGGGLSEAELAELEPIVEAQTYTLSWRDAIADGSSGSDFLAGYADIHGAVISYLKSIHGSMYPELPDYQPRVRYKHAKYNFGNFDFMTELLDTELAWFRRADTAHAVVYRGLLRQTDQALAGGEVARAPIALDFSAWIDTKFRYLMAHNLPEPGGQSPPPGFRSFDRSLPQHLGQAFSNALSIDLPDQDNALVRRLYFDAIQEARERSEAQP